MANDYKRLKEEANIDEVVNYLGLSKIAGPITRILCPMHNDHSPTMYYKKGWHQTYCPACAKGMSAPDLISAYTGKSFKEACEVLWEIEGRPDWYKPVKEDENKNFSTTPEEENLLGINNCNYIKYIAYESPDKVQGGKFNINYYCEGFEPASKEAEYYTQAKITDIPLPCGWSLPATAFEDENLIFLEENKEYTVYAYNPNSFPLKIVFKITPNLKKGQEQTFSLDENGEEKYTVWNVVRIQRRDFMDDEVYAEYVSNLAYKKMELLNFVLVRPDEYFDTYLYMLSENNDFFKNMDPDEVINVFKKTVTLEDLKNEYYKIREVYRRAKGFLGRRLKNVA